MDDSFQNYCIVCDRLIAPPPPAPSDKKPLSSTGGKKRAAPAGAIRIKNPDGSTTTRTANGVKTTRPQLRPGHRQPPSAAAQPSNATDGTKVAPKALVPPVAQPPALTASLSSSGSGDSNVPDVPPSDAAPVTPATSTVDPFVSSIYCSRECAVKDAGSSTAAANDLGRAFGVGYTYSDLLVAAGLRVSPVAAPPSPLLGSDTDSSTSAALRGVPRTPDALVGTSVPKTIESFRLPRDSPDDAWRESRTVRPTLDTAVQQHMSRQRSSAQSTSGTSSDSLASLWNGDNDLAGKRSSSIVGSMCVMTPLYAPTPDITSARRSNSSSSDGSGIQRPALPRSALSHTSLGGLYSPGPNSYHHEVGSAPSHTAYLMQAYASAFPARDGGALSPPAISGSATPDNRSAHVSIAPVPLRQSSGTIRSGRNRQGSTGATWDSFGKAEVRERVRRNTACSESEFAVGSLPQSPDLDSRRGRHNSYCEATPRQSFEVDSGGWQIRYMKPAAEQRRRNASRSRSRSREPSYSSSYVPTSPAPAASALPLPIPVRARPGPSMLASSNSTARSRTPQTGGTPLASRGPSAIGLATSPLGSRDASSTALPDVAALHIGAAASSLSMAATALSAATATAATASTTAAATTAREREYAMSPSPKSTPRSISGSIPRAGFDWEKRSEHRTYELPKGVVQNPNKGLFYFNV